ncbi:MAG TPA: hypothetical protein PKA00_09045 [Saprospiraceae bacterium]|nr:hypothetical protein [Saprospiraceae bacterium]HMQ83042.1 hypothetical protein [Saprospiraceae bacterium]
MHKLPLIIILMVLFSCKGNKPLTESTKIKHQTILIEFNNLDYEPFGVLTKRFSPLPIHIKLGIDTFFLENDSLAFYCVKSESNLMTFEYQEENYKVNGEFILPDFYHIKKNIVFDIETYFTKRIVFEPYSQPIRNGEWVIIENKVQKKIDYNIEIDDSQLKNENEPTTKQSRQ